MCPDRKILSLYHDEELPSPWKEKMEAHLESCQKCRAGLARYQGLRESLRGLREESLPAAQERVWKKLTAPELIVSEGNRGQETLRGSGANSALRIERPFPEKAPRGKPAKAIWNRSITLPLPAAAAAAVIILAAFFAALGTRGGSAVLPEAAMAAAPVLDDQMAAIGLDDQGMVSAQDMSGVLKYLSSQDNEDFVVISLPESSRFSRAGEPALINAADYSRRRNSR